MHPRCVSGIPLVTVPLYYHLHNYGGFVVTARTATRQPERGRMIPLTVLLPSIRQPPQRLAVPSFWWSHSVCAERTHPLVVSLIMTGLSDLVVLVIGKLYGKIQEHAPLSTFILALVGHLSSELLPTTLTHVRSYSSYTDSSRNMNHSRRECVRFFCLSCQLQSLAPSKKVHHPSWAPSSERTPHSTRR